MRGEGRGGKKKNAWRPLLVVCCSALVGICVCGVCDVVCGVWGAYLEKRVAEDVDGKGVLREREDVFWTVLLAVVRATRIICVPKRIPDRPNIVNIKTSLWNEWVGGWADGWMDGWVDECVGWRWDRGGMVGWDGWVGWMCVGIVIKISKRQIFVVAFPTSRVSKTCSLLSYFIIMSGKMGIAILGSCVGAVVLSEAIKVVFHST